MSSKWWCVLNNSDQIIKMVPKYECSPRSPAGLEIISELAHVHGKEISVWESVDIDIKIIVEPKE